MLVIVGHGPSIVGKRLGSWLDKQEVVRLKHAERPNALDWGTRTDFVCASSPSFWTDKRREDFPECEKWVLASKDVPKGDYRLASREWYGYFRGFKPEGFPKPSTGLKAVFCAVEFLKPKEIGLIGFDRILRPDVATSKWFHEQGKYLYGHDAHAEHRCLFSLPVKVVDLGST
jgi:hypothetical protein